MAFRQLETIVDLYFRAMREPPPLYCRTSAAWAEAVSRQRPATAAADGEWTSSIFIPREDKSAEHVLVLGGVVPFEELLSSGPTPGRVGRRMGRTRGIPVRPLGLPALGRPSGARTGRRSGDLAAVVREPGPSTEDGRSEPFELYGPLPKGVTLLEASAGTGKTFTIAASCHPLRRRRHTARPTTGRDVHPHGHGRAARPGPPPLVTAAQGLAQAIEGDASSADDLVSAPRQRAQRTRWSSGMPIDDGDRRLRCGDYRHDSRVLPARAHGLGVAGDVERDAKLGRGHLGPARRGCRRPLRKAVLARRRDAPLFDIGTAMEVARAVVGNPAARSLRPSPRRPPGPRCAGDWPTR